MHKLNLHRATRFMAGITVLMAAAFNGCGNKLADESETVIELDLLAEDVLSDEAIPDTGVEIAADENALNETVLNKTALNETASKESAPDETIGQGTQESVATEEPDEFWRKQYEAVLKDWTVIEDYGDLSYLPFYFDEDYAFDSYWLCDVDQNQVPELFLCSSTMEMITAVFTCTEENLVFLTYDNFYGINPETGELVIQGHWHGAGGSGTDEWTAYKVLPDKAEYAMYIDYYDLSENGEEDRYDIYNPQTGEYERPSDGAEQYEELYAIHVEPCITVNHYTRYDISDLSGLDKIQ